MARLPSGSELIIILIIVLLLFGPGRIVKIANELGKGISAFREGLGKNQNEEDQSTDTSGNPESKQ